MIFLYHASYIRFAYCHRGTVVGCVGSLLRYRAGLFKLIFPGEHLTALDSDILTFMFCYIES